MSPRSFAVAFAGLLALIPVASPVAQAMEADARTTGRLGTAKILILNINWNGEGATTGDLRTQMVTATNRYWDEVSGGRFRTRVRITDPLNVKKPDQGRGLCFLEMGRFIEDSQRLARRQGLDPEDFDIRIFIYPYCETGGRTASFYSATNSIVMQEPNPADREFYLYDLLRAAVHEEGHGWGLGHADRLACRANGVPVTWSTDCRKVKYGDRFDQMGDNTRAGEAGWFNAAKLWALRWLPQVQTVTSSRTVRLSPLTNADGAVRALRIPGSNGRTYWVEYRTRSGLDAGIPEEGVGVQIRVDLTAKPARVRNVINGGKGSWRHHTSYLLDPTPETDEIDIDLAPGTSWTTPEGIEIRTDSLDSDAALVSVTR